MGIFDSLFHKKQPELLGLSKLYVEHADRSIDFDLQTGLMTFRNIMSDSARKRYESTGSAAMKKAWDDFYAPQGRLLRGQELSDMEKQVLPLVKAIPLKNGARASKRQNDFQEAFLKLTASDGRDLFYTNAYHNPGQSVIRYETVPPAFTQLFDLLFAGFTAPTFQEPEPGAKVETTYEVSNSPMEILPFEEEAETLTKDWTVSRKRLATSTGRYVFEIRYRHTERLAIATSWGSGREDQEATLTIPEEVRTKGDLKQYIRENRPNWLLVDRPEERISIDR